MSVAKDDPNPMLRRVAVRAVSGSTDKRILIRVGDPHRVFFKNKGAMMGGNDVDDLGYLALGQIPDSAEDMFLQPGADPLDLPDDSADLENESAEPLSQRLERLQERIRTIPLPKIVGGESVSIDVPPAPPESPSKNPSASPSPR